MKQKFRKKCIEMLGLAKNSIKKRNKFKVSFIATSVILGQKVFCT